MWRSIFAQFSAGIGDAHSELEYRQKQVRQLMSGAEEWKATNVLVMQFQNEARVPDSLHLAG